MVVWRYQSPTISIDTTQWGGFGELPSSHDPMTFEIILLQQNLSKNSIELKNKWQNTREFPNIEYSKNTWISCNTHKISTSECETFPSVIQPLRNETLILHGFWIHKISIFLTLSMVWKSYRNLWYRYLYSAVLLGIHFASLTFNVCMLREESIVVLMKWEGG